MRQGEAVGIMGGTFDPIHYGHLVIAEGARVEYDLSEVIYIPSGMPPHKRDQTIFECRGSLSDDHACHTG